MILNLEHFYRKVIFKKLVLLNRIDTDRYTETELQEQKANSKAYVNVIMAE